MLIKKYSVTKPVNKYCSPILIILILLVTQCAVAQIDQKNHQQQVLKAQSARFSAMVDTDTNTLNKLLASELIYGHTTGRVETKAQFLASIEAKKVDYLSLNTQEVSVSIYGQTATASGLVDAKLMVGERLVTSTIRFLEVYRQIDGTWQLVAWQAVRNTNG